MLQPLRNAAAVPQVRCGIAKESTQKAVSRVEQQDAELIKYARTIVLEVLETMMEGIRGRKEIQGTIRETSTKEGPATSQPPCDSQTFKASRTTETGAQVLSSIPPARH